MMIFKTSCLEDFHYMIYNAVQQGLHFKAYPVGEGASQSFQIEYTGGY